MNDELAFFLSPHYQKTETFDWIATLAQSFNQEQVVIAIMLKSSIYNSVTTCIYK